MTALAWYICLFVRLVAKNMYNCLNWCKSVYGNSRCHVNGGDLRVWNHWKSECSSWSKTQTFPLICQPTMAVDQACNQFSGQKTSILLDFHSKKHFSYSKQTKGLMGKNLGFFHWGTPKTASLMRNLPMNTHNLGIYPNKRGHSFQFAKKE